MSSVRVATAGHSDSGTVSTDFGKLGVSNSLCRNINASGISSPTDVQRSAIPVLLKGENLIVAAETGSGKTLAYLLPLITRILGSANDAGAIPNSAPLSPRILILIPNRELCVQVLRTLRSLTQSLKLTITMIPPPPSVLLSQIRSPDIVVATAAGIRHTYKNPRLMREFFARTEAIVADEADWVVGDGVGLDLVKQAARISKKRSGAPSMAKTPPKPIQFVFAAATMPPIKSANSKTPRALLRRIFGRIATVGTTTLHSPPMGLREEFIPLVPAEETESLQDAEEEKLKCEALLALLVQNVEKMTTQEDFQDTKWLVFCNNAKRAESAFAAVQATRHLIVPDEHSKTLNFHCDLVHGGLTKEIKSTKVLDFVSAGVKEAAESDIPTFRVLICTDIVARGLDFLDVSTVVQMDFAQDATMYLHRIGRTARANKSGRAVSFVSPSDSHLAQLIQDAATGTANSKLQTHFQYEEALLGDGVSDGDLGERKETDRLPLTGAFSRNRSLSTKIKRKERDMSRADVDNGEGSNTVLGTKP
ncbi:P-loop containing nucleoside triphosphate hydrolase protein [Powellomyces hirtus]|nr:P-loop containing nucleoside triphosphate hydrolase protein [Powellomyces hirtus]